MSGFVKTAGKLPVMITLMVLFAVLCACGEAEETEDMSLFNKVMLVGTDIAYDDITDFYYTEENINYDAYYLRYRFYTEEGRHLFFHETRERKNKYGPCTEDDTTRIGTVELSEDQWTQFCDIVKGGAVTARDDGVDSGDSGPWTYLYWKNDKSKYQQFSFGSYEKETKFKEYCSSLASDES